MPNKPKSMRYTTLGYYVVVISEKWRTLGMQENLMLNADHEIEDTVSVTSAVIIICYCICWSIVKKCFISLNAMC